MTKADMRVELDAIIVDMKNLLERTQTLRAEMHNRPPVTRGAAISVTVTPAVEARIIWLHQNFPDMPQHEIGRLAGVQQGRVSEILAGIRH